MSTTQELIDFVKSLNIDYKIYEHEICNTREEKAELDRKYGIEACHCKNIFLTNRQKTSFYLLVMPFEKTFRTSEVSKELNSSRLSFAPEELLFEKLRCRPGTLSTLCLIYDKDCEIPLVIDKELLSKKALCFHPADDSITIAIDTKLCLEKLYPALNREPVFVTVTHDIA